MRIIHCADLHLDSKMSANLDKDKAKLRKQELLRTFTRMIEYASDNRIDGILISGDLFDTKLVSALARNTVYKGISDNPEIQFFYLKGNHDVDSFLSSINEIPDNLHMFDNEWKSYSLGPNDNIKIWGVELDESNSLRVQENFSPDPSKINIVMLHGQEAESISKDKAEVINLKLFKNKGIRYMALGHIHKYKCEALDGEGKYCYCGCLEGRGFDECGDHGFVVLDIDEETGIVKDTFIPFALRKLYEIPVNISGLSTSPEILEKTGMELRESKATKDDLVKLVFCGDVDIDTEIDTQFVVGQFKEDYYFIKAYDETTLYVDYEAYALDESLKGEFVRTVKKLDIDDNEKARIIMCGLNVLAGGKPEE